MDQGFSLSRPAHKCSSVFLPLLIFVHLEWIIIAFIWTAGLSVCVSSSWTVCIKNIRITWEVMVDGQIEKVDLTKGWKLSVLACTNQWKLLLLSTLGIVCWSQYTFYSIILCSIIATVITCPYYFLHCNSSESIQGFPGQTTRLSSRQSF